MSAVDAAQSGTASALMGTLMFVFGGIVAPLAGLWRRNNAGNQPRDGHLLLPLALLLGLSKPRDAR
ncbi:hypothetical protein MJK72_28175 [Klebsiella pneumoniae]|nr:hypothetical protein MJK72_28175 [Klebsiella pneumoniae]